MIKDDSEALNWFRKAAQLGDPNALNALGVMYYSGEGVTQDYLQAAICFPHLADQGNVLGQAMLGSMYEEGKGLTQSNVLAYQWFFLANASSSQEHNLKNDTILSMESLALKMTSEEIADAKKAAASWLTLHPTPK